MGTSTDAHCYACGNDTHIMLGGGMLNFRTFDAWPIRCARCPGIAATNLKDDPRACLDCGGTDISFFEELFGGPAEAAEWERLSAANRQRPDSAYRSAHVVAAAAPSEVVEAAAGHVLTKGRYACPACGEPQLRFGTEFMHGKIMWD